MIALRTVLKRALAATEPFSLRSLGTHLDLLFPGDRTPVFVQRMFDDFRTRGIFIQISDKRYRIHPDMRDRLENLSQEENPDNDTILAIYLAKPGELGQK